MSKSISHHSWQSTCHRHCCSSLSHWLIPRDGCCTHEIFALLLDFAICRASRTCSKSQCTDLSSRLALSFIVSIFCSCCMPVAVPFDGVDRTAGCLQLHALHAGCLAALIASTIAAYNSLLSHTHPHATDWLQGIEPSCHTCATHSGSLSGDVTESHMQTWKATCRLC